jgi:hypothetical protein
MWPDSSHRRNQQILPPPPRPPPPPPPPPCTSSLYLPMEYMYRMSQLAPTDSKVAHRAKARLDRVCIQPACIHPADVVDEPRAGRFGVRHITRRPQPLRHRRGVRPRPRIKIVDVDPFRPLAGLATEHVLRLLFVKPFQRLDAVKAFLSISTNHIDMCHVSYRSVVGFLFFPRKQNESRRQTDRQATRRQDGARIDSRQAVHSNSPTCPGASTASSHQVSAGRGTCRRDTR